jgi:3-oxoacyl-[acyl-carrier-protein] synthase-1
MDTPAIAIIPPVYAVADNITSPIGQTTLENLDALKQNRSGVQTHTDLKISPEPFFASLFTDPIATDKL